MSQLLQADIAIIGAGAGGLSVAAGAVQMGASVILIEQAKMGGDCLNTGCVPSKALLAAAHAAEHARRAERLGVKAQVSSDFNAVMAHVQKVIATIAVHDSVTRFEQLGVHVISASARFLSSNELLAGNMRIRARRFVIATGSVPLIPPIPGLAQSTYYTNETIFSLKQKPEHLLIIGGGPIGCELAQAFLLLDIKVTLIEMAQILPRDDVELVTELRQQLLAQGLSLFEQTQVIQITQHANTALTVTLQLADGQQQVISASHLLVAAGRKPDIASLDLAAAGVAYTQHGIKVDERLRSSNKKIFAIGDVLGHYQFTHVASYQAGIIMRNALFHLPAKVNYKIIPWVTYTSPELAHVGLPLDQALQTSKGARLLTWPFSENDRAQTEGNTIGRIKVVVDKKGIILGVSILGPHAGELLLPWILALQQKQKIRQLASAIVPYPTLSEMNKRVAGEFFTSTLFSPGVKRIVRWLQKWG